VLGSGRQVGACAVVGRVQASRDPRVQRRDVLRRRRRLRVSLAELRQDYDRRLVAFRAGDSATDETEQSSTVNQVGGVDDLWAVTARRDITYCVSNSFGADKARTIAEMAQATKDWERYGNFHFRYVPAQDAACDNTNLSIVFAVQPGPAAARARSSRRAAAASRARW